MGEEVKDHPLLRTDFRSSLIKYYERAFSQGKGLYKSNIIDSTVQSIIYDRIRLHNTIDCGILKSRMVRNKVGMIVGDSEFELALGHIAFDKTHSLNHNEALRSLISVYTNNGIKETFGINLFDFINLSDSELRIVVDSAKAEMKKKAQAMDNMKNSLDNSVKGEMFDEQ